MDIGNHLLYALQTHIRTYLSTGYFMIDLVVSIICAYFFSQIFSRWRTILSHIKEMIGWNKRHKSEYLIEGKVCSGGDWGSHQTFFPEEYRAVMFKLHQLEIDIKFGKKFNQFRPYNNPNPVEVSFSYTINNNDPIKINEHLFVKQINSSEKSNDLKLKTEYYDMCLFSDTKDFKYIKEIVELWHTEYKNYIKEYTNGKYYYFSYLGLKKKKTGNEETNDLINDFEVHEFSTNRNFTNIFFTQKDDLKKRLDIFLTDRARYDRLGIPYTLGLMFYGLPGCGKTSTIKAIANYSKRHVLEINLSRIKTCGELKKVFLKDIIANRYVPSEKKIIVLEDIDCMSDVVEDRGFTRSDLDEIVNDKILQSVDTDSVDKSKEKSDARETEADKIGLTSADNINPLEKDISPNETELEKKVTLYTKLSSVMFGKQDEDKLTLSFILNLIDGILEQPGRILIITTNFPDKLDKALVRPGRIDMKIEFKKCSSKIIRDMLQFYYQEKIDPTVVFDGNVFTPAELYSICFNNTLDSCISKIIAIQNKLKNYNKEKENLTKNN